MKIGDLVKYCDDQDNDCNPVHVAQDFSATIGIIVETCQHWEWAKVLWNNGDSYYRKHYFYQLEVLSEGTSR